MYFLLQRNEYFLGVQDIMLQIVIWGRWPRIWKM